MPMFLGRHRNIIQRSVCHEFNLHGVLFEKFKQPTITEDFQISLQNKFNILEDLNKEEDIDIEVAWGHTKTAIVQSCEEAVGFTQQNHKRWMSDETWFKVNERRAIKEKLMNATTRQQKKTLQDLYSTTDKEVKKSVNKMKELCRTTS